MTLHETLGQSFGYFQHDMKFYEICEKVFWNGGFDLGDGKGKNPITYEDLWEAVDCTMIWTEYQWEILKAYCTPDHCDLAEALEVFTSDLWGVVEKLGIASDD